MKWTNVFLGVLVILGILSTVYAQSCSFVHCKTCPDGTCEQCTDGYSFNFNRTLCCSIGCNQDQHGYPVCLEDDTCFYTGCNTGYYSSRCSRCTDRITYCDTCNEVTIGGEVQCTKCATNKYLSDNLLHCCANPGCNQCSGSDNSVCTSCKPGWFLYQNSCDQCGTTCQAPADGSARCNAVSGNCLYGCIQDYHGNTCQRNCDIPNCDTCNYVQATDNLTCADCAAGRYGISCEQCNSHCILKTGEICLQDGTCNDGCDLGFRGSQCNIQCNAAVGMENCIQCERYNFRCTTCQTGYWGTTCQNTCYDKCVPQAGSPTAYPCEILDGTCVKGCQAGYFKNDCRGSCPNCGAGGHCNRTTGVCMQQICDPGWFGASCNNSCPANCKNNTGQRSCDFNTGRCSNGCQDGYFGDTCTQHCSINCAMSPAGTETGTLCVQANGDCVYACKPGYYRSTCRETCQSQCVDNTCNITTGICTECEKGVNAGYLCPDGACDIGFFSQFCNNTCSTNCAGGCERYTARCAACVTGTYGATCNQSCGNCATNTCEQTTGFCIGPCRAGYYNNFCRATCLYSNCETCDKTSGVCSTCKQGFYGTNCEQSCSSNCYPDSNNLIYCSKDLGYCKANQCVPGYWDDTCSIQCEPTCLPDINNDRICEFQNGHCIVGCESTNYGDFCRLKCSNNCVSQLCKRNGVCTLGCVAGKFGEICSMDCTQTCNDGTCDRSTGECAECNKPLNEQTPLCRSADCPLLYYGLKCNETCAANCRNGDCDRYSARCTSCVADYWGGTCTQACGHCRGNICYQNNGTCPSGCDDGFYSIDCTVPCTYPGCQTCDDTGACASCKQGRYGTNCDRVCSGNCLPSSIDGFIYCSRSLGSCSENQCVPGYYSSDCSQQCSSNCGVAAGFRSCDIDDGECDAECELTWYGPNCRTICSSNCLNQNCNRTGECREGCTVGYWGEMCERTCTMAQTCNDGTCDQGLGRCLECERVNPSPRCRSAACTPSNTWGVFCDRTCPANCRGDTCDRDTGECAGGCKDTYFGDYCNMTCPNCLQDMCFQNNGNCVSGCKHGYHKLDCNTMCLYPGCRNCDRTEGKCITCKTGLFGEECDRDCERSCGESGGVLSCNRFTGNCDARFCKDGWYNLQCTDKCSDFCETNNNQCEFETGTCSPCALGWYGQKCDGECSTNCKNKNCTVTATNCREGCTDGFWGSECQKVCSVNCQNKACDAVTSACRFGCNQSRWYGQLCDTECGANCVGGVCDRSGTCTGGCVVGYYGAMCENQCGESSKCNDGTCNRETGLCDDCFDTAPRPTNCPTADCPAGKAGDQCTDDCPSTNCLYNQCDRYAPSNCKACRPGYYGNLCAQTCPNCKTDTGCTQDTGDCTAGCRDGWYGPKCTLPCNTNCKSCERNSGTCIVCKDGRWGPACSQLCSVNCKATLVAGMSVHLCDKTSGACTPAECNVGYWHTDCTQQCSQHCLVDASNNRVCEIQDGRCKVGCEDTFYGTTCDDKCSVRCKDQRCTNFATSCDMGCEAGYYGATCINACSQQCAGAGTCSPINGTCMEGCRDGHYTTRCNVACAYTCLDGKCDSTTGGCPDCKTDPVGPNCRVKECDAGWYSPTCDSRCPGNFCLNNKCHRQTGTCDSGCLPNYYGAYCTEVCQCSQLGTETCEQDKGTCVCKAGYTGVLCSETCSVGCIGLTCARDGTCSGGCKAGYYGAECDRQCDACLSKECEASSGVCSIGCIPGYYGNMCQTRCPTNCVECERTSGDCTSCISTFYGLPRCDIVCNANCLPGLGRQCDQSTGKCVHGCHGGFYGDDCQESCGQCASGVCGTNGACNGCNVGYYGSKCTLTCSDNCESAASGRPCAQTNGFCSNGCRPGYFGDACSVQCPARCSPAFCVRSTGDCGTCQEGYYGPKCDNACNNCFESRCSSVNGDCTSGCTVGKYGSKCNSDCKSTCNDGSCDQTSGQCEATTAAPIPDAARQVSNEELSTEGIIGIAAGCFGALLIIVILAFCCIMQKRRADEAKSEIHLPSDMLERLSNHQNMHDGGSVQYPVARVVGDDEQDFILF